ncbi:Gfo/Idh/MocA family protein [Nitratireductor sp. ZSWI3]|uniref:Gfo/Idh/MocA family protein n=1 Tax=Nitratireductor sp. ZSWI3 TaxID=2966359 RepID=UPI00215042B2|nr:Gfo/Idh/MocA family oxidoreductase [Nitratireductor sp. ZSWI3]MCR4267003.1 Gfo/Idh/MocA family oxidoreductase [Nitratireductor sp. ZSWI3]
MTVTEQTKDATATGIAIVGVGKIARDQHVPSIGRSSAFRLAATVSRNAELDGVESFATLEAFLEARPDVPAVALCVPPQVRFDLAWAALQAGRHVLLEKPPGATLAEVETLAGLAAEQNLTLFATWHSRFAPAVAPAKAWLASRTIRSVRIVWKEDVRRWHPGQEWIWEAGGIGVFDPGINALSILTEIMPLPVHLSGAQLTFPENRDTPIAASLVFSNSAGAPVTAEFDWRQTGPQSWDITVETDDGTLHLSAGGATMAIDGRKADHGPEAEYDGIYVRFAELLRKGESEVDVSPLRHVADAFMLGKRIVTDPFIE